MLAILKTRQYLVFAKIGCVPEYVISSDKCSIKILKIAKISCRNFFLDKIAKFGSS